MITKKNSCGSKIPHPTPHNFSNGPFLKLGHASKPKNDKLITVAVCGLALLAFSSQHNNIP